MNTFAEGDRVEFHPSMDIWMQGCRYATVLAPENKRGNVHVLPDKSKPFKCSASNLTLVRRADES